MEKLRIQLVAASSKSLQLGYRVGLGGLSHAEKATKKPKVKVRNDHFTELHFPPLELRK